MTRLYLFIDSCQTIDLDIYNFDILFICLLRHLFIFINELIPDVNNIPTVIPSQHVIRY